MQPPTPKPTTQHLPRLRPQPPLPPLFHHPRSIPPLIAPRIPLPLPTPLNPSPRPPPPKPRHSPKQAHARTAQNPRRGHHKRRPADHAPDRRPAHGGDQCARGRVFRVPVEAPEEEDGEVAEGAEEGARVQVGGGGGVSGVVEVFEGGGCFLEAGWGFVSCCLGCC